MDTKYETPKTREGMIEHCKRTDPQGKNGATQRHIKKLESVGHRTAKRLPVEWWKPTPPARKREWRRRMTLIEILIAYRDAMRENGRQYADTWLIGVCDELLRSHISESVSETGMFLNADGEEIGPILS